MEAHYCILLTLKMKSFMPLKSIIIVHFALRLIFSAINKVSADDLIQSTCKQTPFYDLCVTTLKSDPQSSTADVQGLARIAAEKLYAKATGTLNQIETVLKEAKSPKKKKALNVCAEAYNFILKVDMPEALEAITKGDPKFAQDGASDVANHTHKCGNNFSEPPIASSNQEVHDLSVVVVSIVKTLL